MNCLECNYNLKGSAEIGRCPECGRDFDAGNPTTYRGVDSHSVVKYTYWLTAFAASTVWIFGLFQYFVFVVARISLGHWPRPSLDDPSHINWFVSFLGWIWVVLMVLTIPLGPIVLLMLLGVGGIRSLGHDRRGHRPKMRWLVLGMLVWCLGFMLVRMDPFEVGTWLMD